MRLLARATCIVSDGRNSSANDDYCDEERAFRVAWSAVKREYVEGKDGQWRPKRNIDVKQPLMALLRTAVPFRVASYSST
jgi:hypothetical protein